MSLTSYRAAPPRGKDVIDEERVMSAICGSGGDLLSHGLSRSTIGATGLNFRVRDGIGCLPRANATGPAERTLGGVHFGACALLSNPGD